MTAGVVNSFVVEGIVGADILEPVTLEAILVTKGSTAFVVRTAEGRQIARLPVDFQRAFIVLQCITQSFTNTRLVHELFNVLVYLELHLSDNFALTRVAYYLEDRVAIGEQIYVEGIGSLQMG